MENLLQEIKDNMNAFFAEAEKQVGRGNASAGMRARSLSLLLTAKLKVFRAASVEFDKKCKAGRVKSKCVA